MKPHYDKIRKVKTGSGSTAIQVGQYKGKRFELKKHIGSSKDPDKILELVSIANKYIQSHSPQLEIDFSTKQSEEVLFKRGIKVNNSTLKSAYQYLEDIYQQIGFNQISNDVLKNFAIIRCLEPASKIQSITLLQKYFDIDYKKTTVFRELSKLVDLKDQVELIAVKYAQEKLGFNFTLVFYDVTTLYFETHKSDDFRLNGFSKDNKINQPQVLIGLIVNEIGFPISYDIFKGNTFEGKTIIPVILNFKKKYQINTFTVIADAGMLSLENLTQLELHDINYVVGARTGNLSFEDVLDISTQLNQTNQKIYKKKDTLYEYSTTRAKKDKLDNDKKVEKASYYLSNPSKVMKRSVFLSNDTTANKFKLNETLIKKHRMLEGIKGYKTNITNIDGKFLISRYKDLWNVERSFRIAKSDLEARPIYHRKSNSIKYHILIVFVALCMAKVIEITTGNTLKKVTDELKDKWTIILTDEISGNSLELLLDKKPH